jgi:hypothetical protein
MKRVFEFYRKGFYTPFQFSWGNRCISKENQSTKESNMFNYVKILSVAAFLAAPASVVLADDATAEKKPAEEVVKADAQQEGEEVAQ